MKALKAKTPKKGIQKGKGKGNGKPETKKQFVKMPRELIGMESTHRGQKICFGYHMHNGCHEAVDGDLLTSIVQAIQIAAKSTELDKNGFYVRVNAAAPGVTPHMHWHIVGPGIP